MKTIQVSLLSQNAKRGPGFYFFEVSANDIFKEIKKLKTRKATQNTDMSKF